MRDYIKAVKDLFEAEGEKKTKVKDQTVDDMAFDIDDGTSKGDLTNPIQDEPKQRRAERPALPGGKASLAASRRAGTGQNVDQSLRYLDHLLSRNDMRDEISDEEAAQNVHGGANIDAIGHEPVPPTAENLPAVINTAMFDPNREGGTPDVRPPKWHMVKNLPGYMQQGIRAMGRMVFAPFTDTPIEDIQVMASMIDERDVRVMADWIRRNAIKDDEATVRAEQILPGYSAEISVWNAEGYAFMLVKDHAGAYIYGWPGGRGVHLDAPVNRRRLESQDLEGELLTELDTKKLARHMKRRGFDVQSFELPSSTLKQRRGEYVNFAPEQFGDDPDFRAFVQVEQRMRELTRTPWYDDDEWRKDLIEAERLEKILSKKFNTDSNVLHRAAKHAMKSLPAIKDQIVEKKDKPDRDVGGEDLSEADLSGLNPDDMADMAAPENSEEPMDPENAEKVPVQSSGGTTGTKGTVQDQQRQQGQLQESDDGTADYFAKLAGVRPMPKPTLIESQEVLDLAVLAGIRK